MNYNNKESNLDDLLNDHRMIIEEGDRPQVSIKTSVSNKVYFKNIVDGSSNHDKLEVLIKSYKSMVDREKSLAFADNIDMKNHWKKWIIKKKRYFIIIRLLQGSFERIIVIIS